MRYTKQNRMMGNVVSGSPSVSGEKGCESYYTNTIGWGKKMWDGGKGKGEKYLDSHAQQTYRGETSAEISNHGNKPPQVGTRIQINGL